MVQWMAVVITVQTTRDRDFFLNALEAEIECLQSTPITCMSLH